MAHRGGVTDAHRFALGGEEGVLWRNREFAGDKQAEEDRLRLVQNPGVIDDEGARAIAAHTGFTPQA